MFIFSQTNSIANHLIAEMRDVEIQKDRPRFRHNLERMGELFAYEISKKLDYQSASLTTPLGTSTTSLISQPIVLAAVLRAALPLYQGLLRFFDQAESAFIGAYRGPHREDHSFEIIRDYAVSPSLDDKVLIVIDPMLATGKSILAAYEALSAYGKPASVHLVSIIASTAGVAFIQANLPSTQLWIGALDQELNHKSYIIPGLGDAGDLAFGAKI